MRRRAQPRRLLAVTAMALPVAGCGLGVDLDAYNRPNPTPTDAGAGGAGPCEPAETDSRPCARCGTETRTCAQDGTWGEWGACTGQGECEPDETDSRPCALCGAETRTCASDCTWGDWGTCTGQGECEPNDTQGCNHGCGPTERTCDDTCRWGPCMQPGQAFSTRDLYFVTDHRFHYDDGHVYRWEERPSVPDSYTEHHWWGSFCPRIERVFHWRQEGLLWENEFVWTTCKHTHLRNRWTPECVVLEDVYGWQQDVTVCDLTGCTPAPATDCTQNGETNCQLTADDQPVGTAWFQETATSPYTGSDAVSVLSHVNTTWESGSVWWEEHERFWWDSAHQVFLRIYYKRQRVVSGTADPPQFTRRLSYIEPAL